MKKILLLLLLMGLLVACKHKKPSLSGTEKVEIDDFVDFFKPLALPVQFTDSVLLRHEPDSNRISFAVCTEFVADSVFTEQFGKGVKPKIYPVGKALVPKNESYLFIKAISQSKRVFYLLCFDKDNHFVTAKPLIIVSGESRTHSLILMDSKYTLSIIRQHKTGDGQIFYKKEAFVFNNAGVFILILTESNEPISQQNIQIINPIDTFPHKHKLTGDYLQDKRNFIAVRDGKDANHFLFFIHFEKDNGTCTGELKGAASFISPQVARYQSNGDPCELEFNFGADKVSMKEVEGCGNHRGIKCFFEGTYSRKKEIKPKPTRKKTTKST